MKFNLVDIIIVLLLVSGFISGYKKGLFKQAISTIGLIVVVVLAFLLKNNLSIILYKNCPFFTVGLLKNYSSLNILLYELISFFILFIVFSIILKIILKLFGVIEDIIEDSDLFRTISKLLGGLLGVLESYVSIFVILLVLCLPIFSLSFSKYIHKSKLKNYILNNTILISNVSEPLVKTIDSIADLEVQKNIGKEEFNCKTIEIFKKNKIVTEESLKYLKKHNKLDIKCD
jgi:uncharacterized membrane protein required for colicin V production